MITIVLVLLAVVTLILKTGGGEWYNAPERVGARGEKWVAEILASTLPQGYHVINNIYLPLPDGSTTQIDHVVVSRHGVFVIETKTYSGWIFGDEKSAQWTQVMYRKKSRFQNPIRQNYRHMCALVDCLGISKAMVKDMVVFNGDCRFKTEMPSTVMRCRSAAKYILSYSEVLLTDKEVTDIVSAIFKLSDSIGEDRRNAHVANLHKRHLAVSINDGIPNCPYCGKRMVLRKNRRSGDPFYGCPAYPNCKGTIKIS